MATIRQIEQAGFRHIDGLKVTVAKLWEAQCKHDGVDPKAKFVVFSDDNPFAPFYAKALQELWEAQAAHVPGGGYVGLRIVRGKAVV